MYITGLQWAHLEKLERVNTQRKVVVIAVPMRLMLSGISQSDWLNIFKYLQQELPMFFLLEASTPGAHEEQLLPGQWEARNVKLWIDSGLKSASHVNDYPAVLLQLLFQNAYMQPFISYGILWIFFGCCAQRPITMIFLLVEHVALFPFKMWSSLVLSLKQFSLEQLPFDASTWEFPSWAKRE